MRTTLLLFLLCTHGIINAQGIYNNGAKIVSGTNSYIVITGPNADFKNSSSGTIDNNGFIQLQGNWNNSVTNEFINLNSTGTVLFNGTSTQVIEGALPTNFEILVIDNPAGVNLEQSVIALRALTLTSGKVDLNGNELTLGATGYNGVLTGGNSTAYLISGNSNSKFIRYCIDNLNPYFFPLGDASKYSPISINFASAAGLSSASEINVSVTNAIHPQKGTASNYISRYWTVTPTAIATNTSYSVDYTYAATDVAGLEACLFPFKYNSGGWLAAAGSGAQYTMGSGSVNPGNHTVNWNGLFTFSDFTAFGNGTPLPISLLNFDAYPEEDFVQTKWSTATQTNNDYFTIERSQDAIHFISAGIVKGAGNSNEKLDYSFTDTIPYNGISYYRLKQTDFDGLFTYSNIRKVTLNKIEDHAEIISVYPNPSTINGVYLKTGKLEDDVKMDVKLMNLTGALIYEQLFSPDPNGDVQFIDLGTVVAGIYYLKINIGTTDKTFKLLLTN